MRDYQEFTNWYGGIVIPPPPLPARLRADLNNDGRIDLQDHAILKTQLCGPDECCRCEHDPDCYVDDPCKIDYCADGCCEHVDIPGCCRIDPDCDDYDFCTIACFLNRCLSEDERIRACCFYDEQCDDHTPCTADTCDDFTCQFTHIPDCCGDASDCDDGVTCTRDECVDEWCEFVPDDILCNPGATDQGNDPDADCIWNVCAPEESEADGRGCAAIEFEFVDSPCEDGIACTPADRCRFATIYSDSPTCSYAGKTDDSLCNAAPRDNDPDADCVWNTCSPVGCVSSSVNEAEGSPCDDGIDCTHNDTCQLYFFYGWGFACIGIGDNSACGTSAACTSWGCSSGLFYDSRRGCVESVAPDGTYCGPYHSCIDGTCICVNNPGPCK